MPMLIWTINDYFFYKKRDLYFIRFHRAEEQEYSELPEYQMILEWLKENLPETQIGAIYPFISDGSILSGGYDGSIFIDFDEGGLIKFCDRWEDGNDKSVDERFQCYWIPLEDYKARNGGEIPKPLFWDEDEENNDEK